MYNIGGFGGKEQENHAHLVPVVFVVLKKWLAECQTPRCRIVHRSDGYDKNKLVGLYLKRMFQKLGDDEGKWYPKGSSNIINVEALSFPVFFFHLIFFSY